MTIETIVLREIRMHFDFAGCGFKAFGFDGKEIIVERHVNQTVRALTVGRRRLRIARDGVGQLHRCAGDDGIVLVSDDPANDAGVRLRISECRAQQ